MTDNKTVRTGYLTSLFHQKCSRCRKGNMFLDKNPYHLKRCLSMHEYCPVCGQRLEIEVGFYYGTSYVSYALTVALSVASFVAWWVCIGFSVNDNRFFWWLGINILILICLQPFLMRYSRAIWLSFFVRYDPDWQIHDKAVEQKISDK